MPKIKDDISELISKKNNALKNAARQKSKEKSGVKVRVRHQFWDQVAKDYEATIDDLLAAQQFSVLVYPIKDGPRRHYLLYPVKKKNGKWVGADVLSNGYRDPNYNPVKAEFKSFDRCLLACEVHNKYHGWDYKAMNRMVGYSMRQSKKEQERLKSKSST